MDTSQYRAQRAAQAHEKHAVNAICQTADGETPRSLENVVERLEALVKRLNEAEQGLRYTLNCLETQPEQATVPVNATPTPPAPSSILVRFYDVLTALNLAAEGIDVNRSAIGCIVNHNW
jgi:hypothetical protein